MSASPTPLLAPELAAALAAHPLACLAALLLVLAAALAIRTHEGAQPMPANTEAVSIGRAALLELVRIAQRGARCEEDAARIADARRLARTEHGR